MLKIMVIGHLGKDAEAKNVGGKNVINFSVAHTEKWKDQSGAQQSKTYWVDCAYWTDKLAIVPYLTKGTQVYVEGKPEAIAYVTKENQAGATQRVTVGQIQLLSAAGGATTTGTVASTSGAPLSVAGNKQQQAPAQQQQAPAAGGGADYADDLPF